MASADEMAGWHHQRNGRKLGQTLVRDREAQHALNCEELDTTEQLNNNNLAEKHPNS